MSTNGRAIVAFDANGDGALDLYIRSVQAPEALFLGTCRPNEHYLRVKLRGSPGRDNRDGVGSPLRPCCPAAATWSLKPETPAATSPPAASSPI